MFIKRCYLREFWIALALTRTRKFCWPGRANSTWNLLALLQSVLALHENLNNYYNLTPFIIKICKKICYWFRYIFICLFIHWEEGSTCMVVHMKVHDLYWTCLTLNVILVNLKELWKLKFIWIYHTHHSHLKCQEKAENACQRIWTPRPSGDLEPIAAAKQIMIY